jgi:hypothetical protein
MSIISSTMCVQSVGQREFPMLHVRSVLSSSYIRSAAYGSGPFHGLPVQNNDPSDLQTTVPRTPRMRSQTWAVVANLLASRFSQNVRCSFA